MTTLICPHCNLDQDIENYECLSRTIEFWSFKINGDGDIDFESINSSYVDEEFETVIICNKCDGQSYLKNGILVVDLLR